MIRRFRAQRYPGTRSAGMSPHSSCSLFVPLVVVAVFAFNDANYPAPPWRGFTLDWFLDGGGGRTGLFADGPLLKSVGTSVVVAAWVTLLAVAVGTANAFLLERARFRGKSVLSLLMLAPLVIPGVILGISIRAFASRLAQFADDVGVQARFPAAGAAARRRASSRTSSCGAHHRGAAQTVDTTLQEAARPGASRTNLWTVLALPQAGAGWRCGDRF